MAGSDGYDITPQLPYLARKFQPCFLQYPIPLATFFALGITNVFLVGEQQVDASVPHRSPS